MIALLTIVSFLNFNTNWIVENYEYKDSIGIEKSLDSATVMESIMTSNIVNLNEVCNDSWIIDSSYQQWYKPIYPGAPLYEVFKESESEHQMNCDGTYSIIRPEKVIKGTWRIDEKNRIISIRNVEMPTMNFDSYIIMDGEKMKWIEFNSFGIFISVYSKK